MKITLQVSGRERTFSEEELILIVEKHFDSETVEKSCSANLVQKPTEEQWFRVKPLDIDQRLFEKKREDEQQEKTRQIILQAFAQMKSNPQKYAREFKTMIPKKTWSSTSVIALKRIAKSLGDHNADWVEQALEWAQRIDNGETWEDICNKPDTAKYYRLVAWRNEGAPCLVGGSRYDKYCVPASYFSLKFYDSDYSLNYAVPLVVLYEK